MHSIARRRFDTRAFSLIELSIVLVILGLLVGGILAGRSLIRASELRSLIVEHDRFYTAVQAFKDKYTYLPGDLPNAGSFWGLRNADPLTCNNTPSTTATCNGNGDGIIRYYNVAPYGPLDNSNEEARFWQQLAMAGLIEGSYSGVLATNIGPPTKLSSVQWNFANMESLNYAGDDGGRFSGVYNHTLFPLVANTYAPFLTPEEAWNIDVKADDGKPGKGKVMAAGDMGSDADISLCTTATTSEDTDADYRLDSTDRKCGVLFAQQF